MLSDDEKKKLNNRLRRVIGQVEAVGRMIEDEEYCVDILIKLPPPPLPAPNLFKKVVKKRRGRASKEHQRRDS
ncbi:metal-sensitive transcriptional regulator [Stieleria magnilauensis]|uniref:metal-sensitive transcriptional regulator n=1 Tax=Stieleria magnilauensis TaxID=2527963 RepID=UPI003AF4FFFF